MSADDFTDPNVHTWTFVAADWRGSIMSRMHLKSIGFGWRQGFELWPKGPAAGAGAFPPRRLP
jgi:hypothetical protein